MTNSPTPSEREAKIEAMADAIWNRTIGTGDMMSVDITTAEAAALAEAALTALEKLEAEKAK